MKVRILSAVVGVPLLILAFALHSVFPICMNIVCSIASLACMIELLKAKNILSDYEFSVPCMFFSAIFPMIAVTNFWQILLFLFVFYIFTLIIIENQKYKFDDMAYIMVASGLSTIGLSCTSAIYLFDKSHSCFYITLCIAIPWIADAGAYFIGSFFGKHKLCPNVSPKKTIEGAVGGVLIGTIGAIVDALIFQYFILGETLKIDFFGVLIVAIIGTLTSMVGDLTYSLVKRSCAVKDYGNVIPGHGGILDRCDSIIMTSPMILIFVQLWPLVS